MCRTRLINHLTILLRHIFLNVKRSSRHSERSEESMQLIDSTGFFATLRMTNFDIFVKCIRERALIIISHITRIGEVLEAGVFADEG